ncbi:MAG: hypothetical protein HQL74_09555 [Magnetococcales bacterium]|nr:hypothetical protein [Magnetococcales bacterium]
MQDILKQIVQNGKADQNEFGYYFSLHTPLHAWLVREVKKLTDRSWFDAYLIVKVLGGLVIAVGAAWWLYALFGPVVAGLVLLFLGPADCRLPEHALTQVQPGNISIGLAMLFWGLLARHPAVMGKWLPLMFILLSAMHQLGTGLAGVTLATYPLLRWRAMNRQDGWVVLTGVITIILLLAIPYLVEFPVLGIYRFLNDANLSHTLIYIKNLEFIGQRITLWMELYHLNAASTLGIILFLLAFSLYKRWFVWVVFLTFLVGLCMLTIFTGSHSIEVFGRYWIVMSVLLSGIFFASLILALILLRNGLMLIRNRFPIWSLTQSASHSHGFAPEPERKLSMGTLGMIVLMLAVQIYLSRWFVWVIFLMFFVGLCVLSLLVGSYSITILGRYWIVMSMLLSGILLAVLILAVFLHRNRPLLDRDRFAVWRSAQSVARWHGFATGTGNGWSAGLLGVIVLMLAGHFYLLLAHYSRWDPVMRIQDLAQRGNYSFDQTQPARLHQADRPCNKVLYVNIHGPQANEGQQIVVMAYFMEKAMQCGALLYTTALYPPDSPGRQFLEKSLPEVTHIVFQNVTHASYKPISLREGQPRLRLWKAVPDPSWRLLLKNPGVREVMVALRPWEETDRFREPLAQFTVPSSWEGWVDIRLPPTVGIWYELVVVDAGDIWLRGLRSGAAETTEKELLWPWDQGIELNFRNYRLETGKRINDTRWNTHFTVAEAIPEIRLSGRVVADRGMTALAVIEPPSRQEDK